MKDILSYIRARNDKFASSQIFSHLVNEKIDPVQRLAFAPYMAHFVFSFMDINRFILRDANVVDELQELVNIHSMEDAHHWPWYLNDLKKLGFNELTRPVDMLRFIWSDHCIKSRLLSYQMIILISRATTKEKIMIVEAIEMTGNVFLKNTAALCMQISGGKNYEYYGEKHHMTETGHHVGTADIEERLNQMILTESERDAGQKLIDQVYSLYQDFVDEMYEFATHQLRNKVSAGWVGLSAISTQPAGVNDKSEV